MIKGLMLFAFVAFTLISIVPTPAHAQTTLLGYYCAGLNDQIPYGYDDPDCWGWNEVVTTGNEGYTSIDAVGVFGIPPPYFQPLSYSSAGVAVYAECNVDSAYLETVMYTIYPDYWGNEDAIVVEGTGQVLPWTWNYFHYRQSNNFENHYYNYPVVGQAPLYC